MKCPKCENDWPQRYGTACPRCDTELKSPPPSPFALVTLESLTIKRFDHKDEWRAAMNAIHARGKEFVALKYHHGAETYITLDRCD